MSISRTLSRPISRAISRGISDGLGGSASAWSPTTLFANSENGAWYDPSDLSTLFQDSAGTTPVTSDGDPVGKILDQSGNGNHLTQTTAAARPLYKTSGGLHWLDFDGTDDWLESAAVDLSGTNTASVFAGIRKERASVAGASDPIFINGDAGTSGGAFAIYAPHNGTARDFAWSVDPATGGSQSFRAVDDASYEAPVSGVIGLQVNTAGADNDARLGCRWNGATLSTFSADASGGTGTGLANETFRVGLQVGTSDYYDGRIYSLVVTDDTLTVSELASLESYVAGKTGVTL